MTGRGKQAISLKWVLVLSGTLGALAVAAALFLDAQAATWCNEHLVAFRRSPWISAAKWLGRTFVPLWITFLFAWATGRRKIIPCMLLALVFAGLTVMVIKPTVGRPRPDRGALERPLPPKEVEGFKDLSFPSGDAAEVFATAFVLAAFLRGRWKIAPLVMAAGIASLRFLSARHNLSDALAGAGLGLLCGQAALLAGLRLTRYGKPGGWARSGIGFWILVLLPLTDLFFKESRQHFADFLRCYGPFVACLLIAVKGKAWLRWIETPGRDRACITVIVLLFALAVIPTISWTTLYDRDEGYYAESAREMIELGHPFIPHVYGEWWMEKPPLPFDLMAASMLLFGESEFSARLPSALCGLLAMWLTFRLARRIHSTRAAALAAVMLGTTLLFTMIMRLAMLDTPLVCCVILSMAGLHRFIESEGKSGWVLFFAGCGLGTLVKGPLGIALPVSSLLCYVVLTRRWKMILQIHPFRGALITSAIAALWAVPAAIVTRGDYFHELIWVRTLQPVFDPLQGHGGGNPLTYFALLPYYIPVLFLTFGPWSVGLWPALRRSGDRFLLAWIAGPFILFSLVSTKLAHYVLPYFPAVAIVISGYLDGREALWGKIGRWSLTAGGGLLGMVILAAPFILGFPGEFTWFVPAGLATFILTWRIHRKPAIPLIASGVLLVAALLLQVAAPPLDEGKSARTIAQFLHERYDDEVRVGVRRYREISFCFYYKGPVEKVAQDGISEFLTRPGRAVLVLPQKYLDAALEGGMEAPYEVVWKKKAWTPQKNKWVDYLVIEKR
jgi:4-amino-4-deoxy-L-arabinose transferase-like glycosyltransferase/membrane-associated phospholipid phosphatase